MTTSKEDDLKGRRTPLKMTFDNWKSTKLFYNIYRFSSILLKTFFNFIFKVFLRWKMISREDDLNRRQLLITGNKLNLL